MKQLRDLKRAAAIRIDDLKEIRAVGRQVQPTVSRGCDWVYTGPYVNSGLHFQKGAAGGFTSVSTVIVLQSFTEIGMIHRDVEVWG